MNTIEPITRDEARCLLSDEEFRKDVESKGVDFYMLVYLQRLSIHARLLRNTVVVNRLRKIRHAPSYKHSRPKTRLDRNWLEAIAALRRSVEYKRNNQ